jgi:hypothetical protein
VDIGLERDAFLYVSDFMDLEQQDEDLDEAIPANRPVVKRVRATVQKRVARRSKEGQSARTGRRRRPKAEASGEDRPPGGHLARAIFADAAAVADAAARSDAASVPAKRTRVAEPRASEALRSAQSRSANLATNRAANSERDRETRTEE